MEINYTNNQTGFRHTQEIKAGEPFYVIGSNYEYKVIPNKMRYTITVEDEGIPVCEIRFNDEDLANIIGEQLTRLIGGILTPSEDDIKEQQMRKFWGTDEI